MLPDQISTDRLFLRAVTPADAETIAPHCAEPRIYRMLTRMPPNQSVDDTRAFLSRSAEDPDAHSYTIWDGAIFCGLVSIQRQPTGLFNLGYWSPTDAWGKGHMTEAASTLRDVFVREAGVRALQSGAFHDNPASRAVLRKLGFLQAGWSYKYSLGRDSTERHADMAWIA